MAASGIRFVEVNSREDFGRKRLIATLVEGEIEDVCLTAILIATGGEAKWEHKMSGVPGGIGRPKVKPLPPHAVPPEGIGLSPFRIPLQLCQRHQVPELLRG